MMRPGGAYFENISTSVRFESQLPSEYDTLPRSSPPSSIGDLEYLSEDNLPDLEDLPDSESDDDRKAEINKTDLISTHDNICSGQRVNWAPRIRLGYISLPTAC